MRHQFGLRLASIQEQIGAAIGMQDREGQREGRVRHVMAADVEQPADGIGQGDHRRIGAGFFQVFGQAQALGFALLARQIEGMRHGRR